MLHDMISGGQSGCNTFLGLGKQKVNWKKTSVDPTNAENWVTGGRLETMQIQACW